ncbi:hypothetical protein [Actinoplanes campanulatus]|uniref:hypothetical protein n=1 Tax=Actinoplanes campanulatus TaxID=113559 RepID=UPI001954CAC8|nr:hypothetical protein [Actinoplanes capillaceus]
MRRLVGHRSTLAFSMIRVDSTFRWWRLAFRRGGMDVRVGRDGLVTLVGRSHRPRTSAQVRERRLAVRRGVAIADMLASREPYGAP